MSADYSKLSNERLCEMIKNGRYDCFPQLIARLMPHIKAAALKWKSVFPDTEDLIGEGVIALFKSVNTYNSEKASFSTFANLCVDRAIAAKAGAELSGKRIPGNMIVSIEDDMIAFESAEDAVIRREENDLYRKGVNAALTVLEQKVLSGFLEGRSYADIAADIGVSVKSVDSALQRIRAKLKK